MPRPNEAQIAYWNDRAAQTWTALQERLDAQFAVLTQAVLEAAAPAAGETVLDIGCGCGATVLELARRVGPDGTVLGLDISEPMSARARERIAEHGLTNAMVQVSDASIHPFPAAEADLLFSRFGVMFFDDPTAAFANLRAGMRPGGRMLCAAWRPLNENSWFDVPMRAAEGLIAPPPPVPPHAPGPFAFADAARTVAMLGSAGWREAKATRQDAPMRFAEAGRLDEAVDFSLRMGPLGRALAEEAEDTREKVRSAVTRALRDFESGDGVILQGSVWLYSALA